MRAEMVMRRSLSEGSTISVWERRNWRGQSPVRCGRGSGGRTEAVVAACVRRVEKRRKAMNSPDAEGRARDTDVTREERRYLARNSLVERLGVDPRLAEYLLELRERIEKLEDRLGAP